jgi:hypothetical protein
MPDLRIVALVAAFNEGDVIAQTIAHLIAGGVDVYLLDNGSTDNTVAQAAPFLGRGLMKIERFVPGGGARFAWREILARKEELAEEIDADWFIHHDADELRESPWFDQTLRDGVAVVNRLGYNAIDFEVFTFWPVDDAFRPGSSVEGAFSRFELAPGRDRPQVKCWKKQGARVGLQARAGHEVLFEGRRIFPIRFILRHYPIRSQEHGERKVLQERRERFLREERLQGWHRQYDGFSEGASFLRDANSLRPYEPTAARVYVQVHNRDLEAALEEKETVQSQVARLEQVEAELTTTRAALADAHRQLDVATATASDARAQLLARDLQLSQAHSALHTVTEKLTMALGRVTDLEMSRSWRWTAPLRLVYGLIQREGCPADTSPRPPAPPVNQ